MTEYSVLDWFWWLLASLVILWWWPKHVRADFAARSNIQIANFKVSFDGPVTTPSPEPSPDASPLPSPEISPSPSPLPSPPPSPTPLPVSELPTWQIISSNWGLAESAQSTQLWINSANNLDLPLFEPLTGCHILEDLQKPRNLSADCVTNITAPLAVPATQKIFVKISDAFQEIMPVMTLPTEPGQLLITEVMWPGSYKGTVSMTQDEWLEVFNASTQTLDLGGIEIKNAGISGASLFIPTDYHLPPLSYFMVGAREGDLTLLSKDPDWVTSQLSLSNSKSNLSLVSVTGIELDALPGGSWKAGINQLTDRKRSSAQRKSTILPGNDWSNWTDCLTEFLLPNPPLYWKPGGAGHTCGSPWQATIYSTQ